MNRNLLIISCSNRKEKAKDKLPALKRYTGVNFKVIKKLIRENNFPKNLDTIIISAKYGLINPDDLIDDYEQKMDKKQAKVLNKKIISDFKTYSINKMYSQIFINLGKNYMLSLDGFEKLIPFNTKIIEAKGGIGMKMKQMKEWILSI